MRWFVPVLMLLAASTAAVALDPVNIDRKGVAIHGYDAVAYFTEGKPVAGSEAHVFVWSGATWRFASAEHRELFEASPEKYAPRYGGYCAWAVSEGYTADIDPLAWRIVDGKLYLNYSPKVQARWEEDIPGRIARADETWPKLLAD
jgi:hypothetical protein